MNEYVCINILVRLDHFLRASCIHVYVSNAPSSNLAFFSFFFLTIQANHHYRHNLCSVRPEYVHQCRGPSPTSTRHSPFIFRGASPSIHAELAYGQRLASGSSGYQGQGLTRVSSPFGRPQRSDLLYSV